MNASKFWIVILVLFVLIDEFLAVDTQHSKDKKVAKSKNQVSTYRSAMY
jgi:hypothetical protein